MAYESTPPHGGGRQKTRSASISAPSSASLETILNPPSSNGTPDIGYQRRRPATRTQSARITGARSVSWTWKRRTKNVKPNEWMNEWMMERIINHCMFHFHVNRCFVIVLGNRVQFVRIIKMNTFSFHGASWCGRGGFMLPRARTMKETEQRQHQQLHHWRCTRTRNFN